MQDMTLLERVYALEKGGDKGLSPLARLHRSLARNLTAMLNTRRGNVPIAPDYGISDFTDLGSGFTEESVNNLKMELERVIMRYEPRLENVHVHYAPRPDLPQTAVFSLEATIRAADGASPLRFETILDGSGVVRLKEEDDFTGRTA